MSKYATTSLPEQYRKFKKKDSSFLLKKKKVLTVERIPSPGGKVGYCIREKFDAATLNVGMR